MTSHTLTSLPGAARVGVGSALRASLAVLLTQLTAAPGRTQRAATRWRDPLGFDRTMDAALREACDRHAAEQR